MNAKLKNSRGLFKKTMKIAAIAIFTLALIINVKITLTDPFVLMGEQVFAQTTTGTDTTGTGTGTGTGTDPILYEFFNEEIKKQTQVTLRDTLLCERDRTKQIVTCSGIGGIACTASDGVWSDWSDWDCD